MGESIEVVLMDHPPLNEDCGRHVRFDSSFFAQRREFVAESSVGFDQHLLTDFKYPVLPRGVLSGPERGLSLFDLIVNFLQWLTGVRKDDVSRPSIDNRVNRLIITIVSPIPLSIFMHLASFSSVLWKRSTCPLEVLCDGGAFVMLTPKLLDSIDEICMRIQRWFVVAVYHLGPWEKVHELKQRWLQVLNGPRSNGLYDGKCGKLVDTSEEEFLISRENFYV